MDPPQDSIPTVRLSRWFLEHSCIIKDLASKKNIDLRRNSAIHFGIPVYDGFCRRRGPYRHQTKRNEYLEKNSLLGGGKDGKVCQVREARTRREKEQDTLSLLKIDPLSLSFEQLELIFQLKFYMLRLLPD